MTKTLGIVEARRTLSALVDGVSRDGEPVTLTSHGTPRAVLVGVEAWEAAQGDAVMAAVHSGRVSATVACMACGEANDTVCIVCLDDRGSHFEYRCAECAP